MDATPWCARVQLAVSRFADGAFDWLFIDALHTEQALLDDLHAWWPKVRLRKNRAHMRELPCIYSSWFGVEFLAPAA